MVARWVTGFGSLSCGKIPSAGEFATAGDLFGIYYVFGEWSAANTIIGLLELAFVGDHKTVRGGRREREFRAGRLYLPILGAFVPNPDSEEPSIRAGRLSQNCDGGSKRDAIREIIDMNLLDWTARHCG